MATAAQTDTEAEWTVEKLAKLMRVAVCIK